MKISRSILAISLSVPIAIILGGCYGSDQTLTFSGSGQQLSQSPCPPASVGSSNGSRRVLANVAVARDFCLQASDYRCSRSIFSPNTAEGKATETVCLNVAELGGTSCFEMETLRFNTRAAASLPYTPADSLDPGGEYNREEYVCSQDKLREGGSFLAVGEAPELRDALRIAVEKCDRLSPKSKTNL